MIFATNGIDELSNNDCKEISSLGGMLHIFPLNVSLEKCTTALKVEVSIIGTLGQGQGCFKKPETFNSYPFLIVRI
jgi:hypothetical protein